MSLDAYEDFYYRACLADADDPVAAWKQASEETHRLAEWIEGHEEVHITGPGTDLKLGVAGRHFIAADGKHNMPDGEFFTGPVEDSAEGEITFHLPATYSAAARSPACGSGSRAARSSTRAPSGARSS